LIVPDINLLLYAYNGSVARHAVARRWWEQCLTGIEPVGLCYPVLFGFLRVITNMRGYSDPLTLDEASDCVSSWLERDVVRILHEGPNHVSHVIELLQDAGSTGGNLVSDAQIAAIAMSHKATVHTADRDFMRFRGLDCYFPLDEQGRK
jgi:toxin-antitoxin system PIN domain toxin